MLTSFLITEQTTIGKKNEELKFPHTKNNTGGKCKSPILENNLPKNNLIIHIPIFNFCSYMFYLVEGKFIGFIIGSTLIHLENVIMHPGAKLDGFHWSLDVAKATRLFGFLSAKKPVQVQIRR
uniref:Uncharacterized protein n=1 Tax=Rousettus aegyptiacus TaxID=9407 RepID=A0A7J8GA49_ROUAE|nr:hypothetical protein HJG63_011485 [Rousettus aegyptiacus]